MYAMLSDAYSYTTDLSVPFETQAALTSEGIMVGISLGPSSPKLDLRNLRSD